MKKCRAPVGNLEGSGGLGFTLGILFLNPQRGFDLFALQVSGFAWRGRVLGLGFRV